jgi:hypothetical protein
MPRWFNTAGPNNSADHFTVPAIRRLPGVRELIDQKAYFVLHAPRQVGKTTSLLGLAEQLTQEGRFAAVLLSMEVGAPFPDRLELAEPAILDSWRQSCESRLPRELLPPPWPAAANGQRIGAALSAWAKAAPRPLVVFLDEIDALRDAALVSVLRQIRAGYPDHPRAFPWSLALVGLRDVRDYEVASGKDERLTTSSPFNIKVESLTLRDFTRGEVAELLGQHTAETGQVFGSDALDRAYELTQGQPWLVNALARQVVQVLVPGRSTVVNAAHFDAAKEILVGRQDTHLDSLAERLREPRVRRIIEPIMAGDPPADLPPDDVQFVCDLGLVRPTEGGGLVIANPIYREVIPFALASTARAFLPRIQATWLSAAGRLDPGKLLEAFLAFWREHGEPLLRTAPYHEIAPHLVLMAFLHRVVNGGGTLTREYAIGMGRMDVCLRYGPDTLGIELKVWREGEKDPLPKGLEQIDRYLAGLGLATGWLVIFDRRSGLTPIAERTSSSDAKTPSGREVVVVRA